MRKYVLWALLAGTVASPAMAQQDPFSGVRVEGQVGYDTTKIEGESSDGISYGGAVGYDFRVGGAVVGAEAEASDSTVDECVSDVTVVGDQLCANAGRDLYVGGRVGAVVRPNLLVYGKAGYTNSRISLDYDDGTAATTADFEEGENLDGVRVGGGVELGLSEKVYAKTEYRYSNYEQGFDRHQVVAGLGIRF